MKSQIYLCVDLRTEMLESNIQTGESRKGQLIMDEENEHFTFVETPDKKPQKEVESFAYLCKKEKQEEILTLLNSYLQGKSEPNDIMMPFRAAMDAGVIRKPTFREFTRDFDKTIAKSTFDGNLRTDKHPFEHIAAFREMVEVFKKILKEEI